MPLVVQNATGSVAGANSYVTLAFFKAYALDYGHDISSYTDTQLEQALVRARLYIDTRFSYVGVRVGDSAVQITEFPRYRSYSYGLRRDLSTPVEAIPLSIQQAQCEYALIALTDSLYPTQPAAESNLKKYRVKVASIEEEKEFWSSRFIPLVHLQADNLVRSSGWVSSEARISWLF